MQMDGGWTGKQASAVVLTFNNSSGLMRRLFEWSDKFWNELKSCFKYK